MVMLRPPPEPYWLPGWLLMTSALTLLVRLRMPPFMETAALPRPSTLPTASVPLLLGAAALALRIWPALTVTVERVF